jgi:putative endonuclease
MKNPAVYILASKMNGTLYIGVTSDLPQRIWQHKNHLADGFTKKYDVSQLVFFEQHVTMESAIVREKQLKRWKREWKIELIESKNPEWIDLFNAII